MLQTGNISFHTYWIFPHPSLHRVEEKVNFYATLKENKFPHMFGCFNILHKIIQEYLPHIETRKK